ncbi:MAG TPA: glycoside hydrolase family 3 N-terminal domain-containing protein [Streptosporangiaceae bacterium]|jgi:beta-N-acetylhexosaminidase|nr:glycoside hydrolase family 3 N-terminal domain-containing protein [Streptosporangiaceae bacterium]
MLAVAGLAGVAAGCGTKPAVDPSHTLPMPAHPASASAHAAHATSAPAAGTGAADPAPAPAAAKSCPAAVLTKMTEAERIGQLFLVGLPGNQVGGSVASTITAHHFGSAIFGANSAGGVTGARQVANAVQALADPATAGVKFFVAANQEGGQVQALKGPGISSIPSALSQGSAHVSTLRKLAMVWGDQLRAAGVNLNLAPVMDVVPPGTDAGNAPIGALQREYGHDPATVASHGVAFLNGMAGAGVATTAKHFPGLGRVHGNTDFTSSVVDTSTTASDPYLQTYQAAINAGVPLVMVALATYTRIDPHHLAVFSPTIMGTLLRTKLNFRGTIISDDMGAAVAVGGVPPGARAVDFIAAGGDLITTESLPVADAMDAALLQRAGADRAFRAQVDAAALHVLETKQAYGLLPCSK